ncbi:MAG: hypothetical protein IPN71_10155 [Fibrobacteres bacterium]|nr:hypothetical protein [Fibrobacterota bacterium]
MDLETTLREVFDQTEILRRPVNGIVSGYHELPYRVVGPLETGSVKISGTIRVSPRMVLTFRQLQEQFGKFFDGDDGFMDQELVGRSFQFAVARDPSKSLQHEALRIERSEESFDSMLERLHEDLQRAEDTRTGLISCPSPRFYPVSVDRFIREILDRELGPGK